MTCHTSKKLCSSPYECCYHRKIIFKKKQQKKTTTEGMNWVPKILQTCMCKKETHGIEESTQIWEERSSTWKQIHSCWTSFSTHFAPLFLYTIMIYNPIIQCYPDENVFPFESGSSHCFFFIILSCRGYLDYIDSNYGVVWMIKLEKFVCLGAGTDAWSISLLFFYSSSSCSIMQAFTQAFSVSAITYQEPFFKS